MTTTCNSLNVQCKSGAIDFASVVSFQDDESLGCMSLALIPRSFSPVFTLSFSIKE